MKRELESASKEPQPALLNSTIDFSTIHERTCSKLVLMMDSIAFKKKKQTRNSQETRIFYWVNDGR